jgi:hypothetical protein
VVAGSDGNVSILIDGDEDVKKTHELRSSNG